MPLAVKGGEDHAIGRSRGGLSTKINDRANKDVMAYVQLPAGQRPTMGERRRPSLDDRLSEPSEIVMPLLLLQAKSRTTARTSSLL